MKKPNSSLSCINNPASMEAWFAELKDERNVLRTTSLFWEVRREREDDPRLVPLFTLKSEDHTVRGITYISLKQIYFSYSHVPGFEYQFALDVFNSWDHWIKITKSSIRHEFQAWRDELDIKLKADALRRMIEASKLDGQAGLSAVKYLADKGYIEGEVKRKAGRPTKDEVERERIIAAKLKDTLAADMERVGLTVAK